MSSTSTFTPAGRSLSSDAIEATRALASRERQADKAKKKSAKGAISLGGSLTPPRYVDKAVRFTPLVGEPDGGITAVRTVSVSDPSEIPNLTRDQKEDLKRMWDREEAAGQATKDDAATRGAAAAMAQKHKLSGTYEEVKADGHTKVVAYDDATPERLAQATGVAGITTTAGVRQFSDPFSVLRNKGLLDKDKAVNEALFSAGMELRRRYDQADLGGVKAMNLMKDIVDGGAGDAGCPIADRAWDARRKIRDGHAAVGARLWPYVMGVVVEDRTVESLSGMVQDSKAERLRYVIAMERLREALHRLCEAWGIQANDKPRAIQSLRAGDEERSFERRGRGA